MADMQAKILNSGYQHCRTDTRWGVVVTGALAFLCTTTHIHRQLCCTWIQRWPSATRKGPHLQYSGPLMHGNGLRTSSRRSRALVPSCLWRPQYRVNVRMPCSCLLACLSVRLALVLIACSHPVSRAGMEVLWGSWDGRTLWLLLSCKPIKCEQCGVRSWIGANGSRCSDASHPCGKESSFPSYQCIYQPSNHGKAHWWHQDVHLGLYRTPETIRPCGDAGDWWSQVLSHLCQECNRWKHPNGTSTAVCIHM